MPLLTTRAGASSKAYGFGSAVSEELGGMVLITPTSVSVANGSASIGSNGAISLTTTTEVNINGCFSSEFTNYVIFTTGNTNNSNVCGTYLRLRASGTSNTSSNYTSQYLDEHGPYRYAARSTGTWWTSFNLASIQANFPTGTAIYVYGPFLSKPTAFRSLDSVGHDGTSTGRLRRLDGTGLHNVATSYDGFSFLIDTAFTGSLYVYGLAE